MSGLQAMAFSALFFSIMTLFVKVLGAYLPNQEIVFIRNFFTLLLTGGALWKKRINPFGQHYALLLLRGLSGFAALSCFFYAVALLPLAVATVIQFTNPIFTAILAAVWLKEDWDSRLKLATLLGLSGVVIIARPWQPDPSGVGSGPLILALAGAILASIAYVSIRKLATLEPPLVVIFYFPLVGTPISAVASFSSWVWPTPWQWGFLLSVGVAAQLGQVFMTRGLFRERAGRATVVGYLQLAFATLWGLLFFSEIPGWSSLLGSVLIIGGVLYLRTPRRQ